MADESLKRLIELGVNAEPAIRELKRLNKTTEDQLSSLDKLRSGLSSAGETLAKVFAAREIIGYASQFVSGVQQMIDSMDDLAKAAQGLGMSTQTLQELRYALDLSGLDTGEATKVIARLGESLGQLDDDTQNTTRLLKEMGITASDDVSSAFDKMADAFANAPDGVNKTNVAIELFGRNLGVKMVAALNAGSEATAELKDELHKLGGVYDTDVIKQSEEFNDNMSKLKVAATALGQTIVADLLPDLIRFTSAMVESIKQGTLLKDTWDAFIEAGRQLGRIDSIGLDLFGGKAAEAAQQTKEADKRLQDYRKTMAGYASDVARMQSTTELPKATIPKPPKAGGSKAIKDNRTELEKWIETVEKAGATAELVPDKIAYLQQAIANLDPTSANASLRLVQLNKELDSLLVKDAGDTAIKKLADDAAKLDGTPYVIERLRQELSRLEDAGKGATENARLLREEILKMKSATDPVAAVTLELNKMAKEAAWAAEKTTALWNSFGQPGVDPANVVKLLNDNMAETDKAIDKTIDKTKSLGEAIEEMGAKFVTDWVDKTIDGFGKTSEAFGDMVEDMLKQLAKLIVQMQIANALKAVDSGGGWGAFFSGLQSVPAPSVAVAPQTTTASAGFLGSPSFASSSAHSGTTLQGGSGGGASSAGSLVAPVNVNIHNNAAQDVEVSTRTTDNKDNQRMIEVFVESKVKKMHADGSLDRTMRSNYGLSRQPAVGA